MQEFSSVSALKYRAKNHMVGRYQVAIGVMLMIGLMLDACMLVINRMSNVETLAGLGLYVVSLIVLFILSGVFCSSQAYLFLNIACGNQVDCSVAFYGIKNHGNKAIVLQAVQTFKCVGYVVVYGGLTMFVRGKLLNPISYLVLIGIEIVVIYFSLTFSQLFYLLHDFPEAKVSELIALSKRCMKGYRLKLLKLEMSFLPMYLVVLCTFGVGSLWVRPYVEAAKTEFYLELMKNRNDIAQ